VDPDSYISYNQRETGHYPHGVALMEKLQQGEKQYYLVNIIVAQIRVRSLRCYHVSVLVLGPWSPATSSSQTWFIPVIWSRNYCRVAEWRMTAGSGLGPVRMRGSQGNLDLLEGNLPVGTERIHSPPPSCDDSRYRLYAD
jgi:hypothetical protein